MASVQIPLDYNTGWIGAESYRLEGLGAYNAEQADGYWEGTNFIVPAVSQASLDSAVATYEATQRVTEQRAVKADQIQAQIPVADATRTIIDQAMVDDVEVHTSAANERLLELEQTADADVEAFDPTITPARPGTQKQSKLSVWVSELDEWAGQPGAIYGFKALLTVESGREAEGAEARISVVDGPDAGAILPFTQDANTPARWWCESRDGHKSTDPDVSFHLALYWGNGSILSTPTLRISGLGDRQATMVRYGPATVSTRRR